MNLKISEFENLKMGFECYQEMSSFFKLSN